MDLGPDRHGAVGHVDGALKQAPFERGVVDVGRPVIQSILRAVSTVATGGAAVDAPGPSRGREGLHPLLCAVGPAAENVDSVASPRLIVPSMKRLAVVNHIRF
jgi:hypothetical protein